MDDKITNEIESYTDESKNRFYYIYMLGFSEACNSIIKLIEELDIDLIDYDKKVYLKNKIHSIESDMRVDVDFKNTMNSNNVSNEAVESMKQVLLMLNES